MNLYTKQLKEYDRIPQRDWLDLAYPGQQTTNEKGVVLINILKLWSVGLLVERCYTDIHELD